MQQEYVDHPMNSPPLNVIHLVLVDFSMKLQHSQSYQHRKSVQEEYSQLASLVVVAVVEEEEEVVGVLK